MVEETKEEIPLTSGILTLTLEKAELTHDVETFGKMDPFVKFDYAGLNF